MVEQLIEKEIKENISKKELLPEEIKAITSVSKWIKNDLNKINTDEKKALTGSETIAKAKGTMNANMNTIISKLQLKNDILLDEDTVNTVEDYNENLLYNKIKKEKQFRETPNKIVEGQSLEFKDIKTKNHYIQQLTSFLLSKTNDTQLNDDFKYLNNISPNSIKIASGNISNKIYKGTTEIMFSVPGKKEGKTKGYHLVLTQAGINIYEPGKYDNNDGIKIASNKDVDELFKNKSL